MASLTMKVEISPQTSSNATIHVLIPSLIYLVVMYRFDNEIIFEERMPNNRAQSDPAAVVIEKDSNTLMSIYRELLAVPSTDSGRLRRRALTTLNEGLAHRQIPQQRHLQFHQQGNRPLFV
jgi:hypothetical protein